MLDVIVGSDPRDEVTAEAAKYIPEDGYKQFLTEDGLKGKRIGIVKHPFVEMIHGAIEKSAFEHHLDLLRYEALLPQSHLLICKITNKIKSSFLVCLRLIFWWTLCWNLRQEGAILVDKLSILHIEEIMDSNNSGEALVMMVEFKSSINAYLKELITSPVRSLADIIAFNERNSELVRNFNFLRKVFRH